MLLLPKNAKLIGQGITGGEGSTALPWMLGYGKRIVAGVTQGKGGQELEGVPIFNTVKEAVGAVGEVDGSVQFVPPIHTKRAVEEALEEGLKFVLIGAEKVPVRDSAYIYALAEKKGASVVGPASVGIVNPHRRLKIGSIGGGDPDRVFPPGNVAILSKSGGMTSELGLLLKHSGLGVSWAVGIGGERIIGSDFGDFLIELENDKDTKATLMFGELGGTYEDRVADLIKTKKIKKPVAAFIAGEFTMNLPSEVQFGHAGAIIEGERGLPSTKRRLLKESGALVAESLDEIPDLLKEVIK